MQKEKRTIEDVYKKQRIFLYLVDNFSIQFIPTPLPVVYLIQQTQSF